MAEQVTTEYDIESFGHMLSCGAACLFGLFILNCLIILHTAISLTVSKYYIFFLAAPSEFVDLGHFD